MALKTLGTITECWLKFDLKVLQHDLDSKVIEIAQQQEEGDHSRKRLIDLSKDFKKNAGEDVRKSVAPILKSFQNEVDNLSKRNKTMETLFLNLYKQLIELPDPSLIFENMQQLQKRAERVSDLEIENQQLRETLDEYSNEFAHVKNQEVTIKQLKDKIKELEDKAEQQLQSRLKEKEKELQRQFNDKDEHAKSIQLDLVKKLGETEAKNSNLVGQLHQIQNEMYELKTKQDELLNAKSCEIDLLLQDLDKSNERATNAERLLEQYMVARNEQKQNESTMITASHNIQNSIDQITTSTLEIELAAKEKEISQLVDDIQKLQSKSNKLKQAYDNEKTVLEEKLNIKDQLIRQLEEQNKLKEDYDEIKRELNILKSIELYDSQANSPSGGADSANPNEQKPLEVLLLEKNRHLQSENTQIKVQNNDVKSKYEDEKQKNFNLLKTVAEQKQLIAELERDLLNVARNEQAKQTSSAAILPLGGSSEMENLDSLGAASEASIVEGIMVSGEQGNNMSSATTAQNQDGSLSLLNIVSSQRERFRLRVQELEMETISYKQQLHIVQGEMERFKQDNVKLYEKIRFLQSYDGKKSGRSIKYSQNTTDDEFVLNKYTNEYEKRLDPFTKFTSNEKQKRIANLKLHDKFTLSLGRFILSSKAARLVFVLYIAIVHLLIFLTTYKIAHTESSYRDISAECAKMYKAHMSDVHGQKDFHM